MGSTSICDASLKRAELYEIIGRMHRRRGGSSVIICGDDRAEHADIRAVFEVCTNVGLDVRGVADQSTPEYFSFNVLERGAAPGGPPSTHEAEAAILIYNNLRLGGPGFVVDGHQVTSRQVEEYLGRRVAAEEDLHVVVKSTPDCPHCHLLATMRICRRLGIESVSVSSK